MSQSPKLSLWQRIKQLLNISAVQAVIDDIKAAKDLELDLGSDLDITEQDNNNSHPSKNKKDSIQTRPKDSNNNDSDHNDNDDTDVSGSNPDLNRNSNHNINHSFDDRSDDVIYNSLSSNIDSRLDSSTDTDTDTDAYFDNDIEGMTKQNSDDDTPIVNYLKQYFDEQQWHYNHYRPRTSGNKNIDSQQSHHLSLRMRNKKLDCG